MSGASDYSGKALLNWLAGAIAMPALPAGVWLGLMTAVDADSGTGGTEVSTAATGYARVQVAGSLAANSTWTTGVAAITMNVSNPGWVVPGMQVFDPTVAGGG